MLQQRRRHKGRSCLKKVKQEADKKRVSEVFSLDWTGMVVNKILLLVGTDDKLAVLCQDNAESLTFKSKMEALTHFDFLSFHYTQTNVCHVHFDFPQKEK